MGITRRSIKGSPINAAEYDANFDLLGGGNTPPIVTISSGVVTLNGAGVYRLETEGGAALDTLTQVINMVNNDLIYIRIANNARQILVEHGTWIKLETEENLLLPNTFSCLYLRNHGGGVVVEERRSIHGPR